MLNELLSELENFEIFLSIVSFNDRLQNVDNLVFLLHSFIQFFILIDQNSILHVHHALSLLKLLDLLLLLYRLSFKIFKFLFALFKLLSNICKLFFHNCEVLLNVSLFFLLTTA